MILESIALQLNGRNLASIANPPRGASTQVEQRRSTHERVGDRVSQGHGARNILAPDDLRNRLSYREGSAESNYRATDIPGRFPCFSRTLWVVHFPNKFKPSNYVRYDGRTEPWQWLRIYSQVVKLVGGSNDHKALFLPMALESAPLAWFDKIKPDSIDSWENLQRMFAENFNGVLTSPSTQHEL